MDTDINTHSSGKTKAGGGREQAPVQGVKVSDIPAGTPGKYPMDGGREQAPAAGAAVSDNLLTSLRDAAMDTSETLTATPERAPRGGSGGLGYSDSIGGKKIFPLTRSPPGLCY